MSVLRLMRVDIGSEISSVIFFSDASVLLKHRRVNRTGPHSKSFLRHDLSNPSYPEDTHESRLHDIHTFLELSLTFLVALTSPSVLQTFAHGQSDRVANFLQARNERGESFSKRGTDFLSCNTDDDCIGTASEGNLGYSDGYSRCLLSYVKYVAFVPS